MARKKSYSYTNDFGRVCKSPTMKTLNIEGKDRQVFSFTLALGSGMDLSHIAFIEYRCWDDTALDAFKEIQKDTYVTVRGRQAQDRFPLKCSHCGGKVKLDYHNWVWVDDFHVVQGLKAPDFKDEDMEMPT